MQLKRKRFQRRLKRSTARLQLIVFNMVAMFFSEISKIILADILVIGFEVESARFREEAIFVLRDLAWGKILISMDPLNRIEHQFNPGA